MTTPGPMAEFPGVPSMKESGYDLEYYLWAGLFAPKAVSKDSIGVLRRAVAAANKDPLYIQAMEKLQEAISSTGMNYLLCIFSFGNLPPQAAMRSLELFAREVMPKLRA